MVVVKLGIGIGLEEKRGNEYRVNGAERQRSYTGKYSRRVSLRRMVESSVVEGSSGVVSNMAIWQQVALSITSCGELGLHLGDSGGASSPASPGPSCTVGLRSKLTHDRVNLRLSAGRCGPLKIDNVVACRAMTLSPLCHISPSYRRVVAVVSQEHEHHILDVSQRVV